MPPVGIRTHNLGRRAALDRAATKTDMQAICPKCVLSVGEMSRLERSSWNTLLRPSAVFSIWWFSLMYLVTRGLYVWTLWTVTLASSKSCGTGQLKWKTNMTPCVQLVAVCVRLVSKRAWWCVRLKCEPVGR